VNRLFQGDQLNIAGHKVPIAILGVAATILAAFILLRGSRNSNAAAIEAQQASGTGPFGGASGTDIGGTLQNLQTQLAAFNTGLSSLNASSAPSPASAPGAVASAAQPAVQYSPAGGYAQPSSPRSLRTVLAKVGIASRPESLPGISYGPSITPPAPSSGILGALIPQPAKASIYFSSQPLPTTPPASASIIPGRPGKTGGYF